ncbi:hypothetical protein QE152_g32254 [Popillia japonica]|uniref:Uncharacterized protein n=1 Tax=Popillia japonica TaxID=7064 RepID=A0AAW1IZQ2_POPJA
MVVFEVKDWVMPWGDLKLSFSCKSCLEGLKSVVVPIIGLLQLPSVILFCSNMLRKLIRMVVFEVKDWVMPWGRPKALSLVQKLSWWLKICSSSYNWAITVTQPDSVLLSLSCKNCLGGLKSVLVPIIGLLQLHSLILFCSYMLRRLIRMVVFEVKDWVMPWGRPKALSLVQKLSWGLKICCSSYNWAITVTQPDSVLLQYA